MVNNRKKDEGQVTTRVSHSLSESCHAEGLTGGSATKKVNCAGCFFEAVMLGYFGHVSEVRDIGIMVFQDSRRESVYFRKPDRFPSERMPCHRRGFDSAAYGRVSHLAYLFFSPVVVVFTPSAFFTSFSPLRG